MKDGDIESLPGVKTGYELKPFQKLFRSKNISSFQAKFS
jgi:hypothetical protein